LRGKEEEINKQKIGYYTCCNGTLNLALSFLEVQAKIEMPWIL